jgi:uncharacterized protein
MKKDVKSIRRRKPADQRAAKAKKPSAQVQGIEAQIQAGVDVTATDKNGVTILHRAVRFRSPSAVQALIELGADVNQLCKRSGSTPLHRAVTSTGAPGTSGQQAEALEIIKLLLGAGSDTSIRNKNGKTPADYVTDETILALLAAKRKADSPTQNRKRVERK